MNQHYELFMPPVFPKYYFGLVDLPITDAYPHLNSADQLPPVDCPLVILVHWRGLDRLKRATRTSYLSQRDGQMEYQLSTGEVIVGRFQWTYP